MNILQISYHTAPYSELGVNDAGGLNLYIKSIVEELRKDNKLFIVTAEESKSLEKENLSFLSYNLFTKFEYFENKIDHLEVFTNEVLKFVRRNEIDLVHAHYWLSGEVALEIKNQLNIPFIYTAHSYGGFISNEKSNRISRENEIIKNADFITASSEYEENYILDNYEASKRKIKKILPGLNKNLFSDKNQKNKENIILSIGRIQEQKGQLKTLDLFSKIKQSIDNVKLYFVGGPSGERGQEYINKINEKISLLDLTEDIKFIGNLSQDDLAELMGRSKLLLHSAKYETFGLVAIESNAAGLPVVSINQGPLKEIISNNNNGYVGKSFEDEELIEFILKVFNNKEFFEKVNINSINSVEKYDWKFTSEKLKLLYQDPKLR